MNILSIFRPPLEARWVYTTKGLVWRLIPAPSGALVGEDRDPTRNIVTFFCLDTETGKARWDHISVRESWWVSLAAVYNHVILIHGFAHPDLPEPQKIFAIDLFTGQRLWEDETLTFLFMKDGIVYASRNDHNSQCYFELDVASGSILRELGSNVDYVNVLAETSSTEPSHDGELPTALVLEGDTSVIHDVIRKHVPLDRVTGDLESIETPDCVVIGYHERMNNGHNTPHLRHVLRIIKMDSGRRLYEDILAMRVATPAPDLFFRRENLLIYIKERNQIKAVELPH